MATPDPSVDSDGLPKPPRYTETERQILKAITGEWPVERGRCLGFGLGTEADVLAAIRRVAAMMPPVDGTWVGVVAEAERLLSYYASKSSPTECASVAAALRALLAAAPLPVDTLRAVELLYTNHRRETAKRRIAPQRLWYGSNEWHLADQWFIDAIDIEKGELRSFALKDFGEPTNIARQEWREVYKLLQEYQEPVAERGEAPDGSVTMSMTNVVRRIIEERGEARQAVIDTQTAAENERIALLEDRVEEEATFNLRYEADMRGIRAWREAAPGRDLTWPDHADLVTWLLEQLATARGELLEARGAVAVVNGDGGQGTPQQAIDRYHALRSLLDDNYRGLRYVVFDEDRAPLAAFKDEWTARDFYRPIKNSGFRTLPEARA